MARIRALLAGGLVLGIGAAGTLAAWTDEENAGSTVQAGTFSLVSQTRDDAFASHGSGNAARLGLDATGLYPGVSKAGWMQIKTSGTLGGTVTLTGIALSTPATTAADQALRDALTVRVVPVAQTTDCTPATSGGTAQSLLTVPTAAQLPPIALTGNGGNTATYCVILSLPSTAPTTAQGGTVSPVWTFTGTTG
ncbi:MULTISPECIES: SipW-dependent-type signal peptide-containing protein [unclassified Microbacterium]|uniref:SipW-dependent-type signal peptide-containing protein n=1 Tax=unclassified Microbacterium TaxID=2609290 RepID=UPI0012F7A87C|nr:SipW-dependent-type signal peptide-containing protein [Microbacterium sp. MAH-37]